MDENTKLWFLKERLVFGLVIILSLTGVFAWFTVNEQEDPTFPYRNGFVSITAPGMSANAIEDTIVKPLERALAAVDQVAAITVDVSDGVASVDVELHETTYETDEAWQRVREEVNDIKSQVADLVTEFDLEDRAQDSAGILLAIETDLPLDAARNYALYVRDELYKLTQIREIDIIGDPNEQIEVFYPQELMLELGLTPIDIAAQINDANALKASGVIQGNTYQSNITPMTRLDDINDLKRVEIRTIDNEIIRLDQIAQVSKNISPVQLESFWVNGKQRIGLSVIVPPNQLRVVDFGEALLGEINRLNLNAQAFTIKPIFFQPTWTEKRRNGLAMSLLFASVGVGIVLFLLMSKKLALVVSITIPAIALTSIAFFGMFGGILQQMSIAGLVISLGLMVDNSIVMSELIAKYRSQGLGAIAASNKAIRALYKPLATSTFTTMAAFVPMLLSKGDVADFIRMIPVIVILAIITSYVYALVLLPTITNNLKNFGAERTQSLFNRLGGGLAKLGTSRPKTALLGFCLLLVLSFAIEGDEEGEFFPESSRNQAFIDIQGDYGVSHNATAGVVKQVETLLEGYSEIDTIISFVGNSGPRFYYNLSESPNEPHIARVVFETQSSEQIPSLVDALNTAFSDTFKSTRVRARQIGQGPPIEAPVEIRVLGDDRQILLTAAEEIFSIINEHPHTIDTRRGYIVGKPKLAMQIAENDLHKAGFTKAELSDYLAWRTVGFTATEIPSKRESLPVVIRDNQRIEHSDLEYLMNTMVMNTQRDILPLTLFVNFDIVGEAPVLTRRNGFNSHVVLADIVSFADEEDVLEALMPQFRVIENKYQVSLDFGGEAEEEEDSGGALLKTLPIGAVLLFSALILQFNSFRIAGLIMLTIPMAMIGVGPMLAIAGVNFGFMSVLGLLALTGVVVNTAIILIDRVIVNIRTQDITLHAAIEQAVHERFRPVMLTAITTIVGMIPLTSPESPLWPPMAWTMIGGLITSTLLALVVLPSLLSMTLNEKKIRMDG